MAAIRYFNDEWETASGWVCGNTSDLGNGSNIWWHFPRLMGWNLDDYIKLLVNKFQVNYIYYNQEYDVLHYAWKSQDAMRKFKNWANAEYRKKVKEDLV